MSIVLNGTTGITTPDLDTDGLTSNGIDDNATSTAMTLDASGNVLVGTSGTNWQTTAGLYAFNQSALNVTRNGAESMNLNRLSSDGDIAKFFKSGTTVGAIKVQSNRLALYCSTANSGGIRFSTAGSSQPVVVPTNNTGADSDATQDLGLGGVRWKDIYLSGGVYLGGTGSANYLSDYETGSFTPTYSFISAGNSSVGYSAQHGYYTKIGNLVHFQLDLRLTSMTKGTASGDPIINGLPFTSKANTAGYANASPVVKLYNHIFSNIPTAGVTFNSTYIVLNTISSNVVFGTLADARGGSIIWISGSYIAS